MAKIKHYFASANTSEGFKNYFDNINFKDKGFTYIIKGGSGTGKSTMLKKIGNYFAELGYEIEFFHCSSDPKSLDGVRIVESNISLIDGTAPHVADANLPEIYDKIVNVGKFINSNVSKNKLEIEKAISQKKECYKKVYFYLKAIGILSEINEQIFKENSSENLIDFETKKLIKNYHIFKINSTGSERKLFINSVDKNEVIDLSIQNNFYNFYNLKYNNFENSKILNNLKTELISRGYDLFCFYDLFNKNQISSIFIPKLHLFIKKTCIFDEKTVNFNNKIINSLIKKVGDNLSNARNFHKTVEKFYIKNMNFDALNKLTTNLISEIKTKMNIL